MELDEVLKGINHHRARIHAGKMWADPYKLSDVGNKLSTYNAYLADFLADAHKTATDKSHSIYLECLGKGESATKAEQMARGESAQERRDYEHIKFVYTATAALISFIQTKIRVNENQMKQEGKIE